MNSDAVFVASVLAAVVLAARGMPAKMQRSALAMRESDVRQSEKVPAAEVDDGVDVTLDLPAAPNTVGDVSPTAATAQADAPPVHVGEESLHLSDQTHALLRNRLRAAAVVLLAMMGFAFIKSFSQPEAQNAAYRFASLFVVIASCAVLFSPIRLSLRQLRLVELVVFGAVGLQAIVMISAQILRFAASGDIASTIGMSVVNYLVWSLIILIYGIFMPNTWVRATIILLPAALVPHLVLAILSRQNPTVAEMLSLNRAGAQSIMPFVALLAAVYAAHLIHSVRQVAFKAQRFGQYHLKERLGAGAMGEVYRAEHLLLKRPCAIKLIRPDKVAHPKVLKRFEKEVKATASLSHWNTVQVFDYGQTTDGVFYYVMELLPGMNLAELVQQSGPMPVERVVHLLRQACNALSEAHAVGLIHRDVKPANIFASHRGGLDDVVKLLDFGLVQQSSGKASDDRHRIAGTPHFMSPEQASGRDVTLASDLYSLGATAYYLLTGSPVFPNRSINEVIAAHANAAVVPPSEIVPEIHKDVEAIILKCLEKRPGDRFHSANDMEQALSQCRSANCWTQGDAKSVRALAVPDPLTSAKVA